MKKGTNFNFKANLKTDFKMDQPTEKVLLAGIGGAVLIGLANISKDIIAMLKDKTIKKTRNFKYGNKEYSTEETYKEEKVVRILVQKVTGFKATEEIDVLESDLHRYENRLIKRLD